MYINILCIYIYILIHIHIVTYWIPFCSKPPSLYGRNRRPRPRCSASGLSGNVFGRLKKHFEDAARRWTRSVQVDETCEDSKIRWILYGFLVNFCGFLWMFIVYRFLWMCICFFREFYGIFMVFNGCLWRFFFEIFMDFWWMVFDVKIQKLDKAIWKTMVT